ncbi:MAG: hypothetical protein ACOYN8_17410 [Pseudanabaena sp.]|jgi:hypothetical protein
MSVSMPQKLSDHATNLRIACNSLSYFTRKELLSDLSYLFYLQRHEPLSYAIAKVKVRKAFNLTLAEFRDIYTAYKLQRGAV